MQDHSEAAVVYKSGYIFDNYTYLSEAKLKMCLIG